ncbi:MAG: hypothetical protein O3B84_02290 [Chloroflexi bacterium]|nr:hypothetical protein [Chloroflexota bacterium]
MLVYSGCRPLSSDCALAGGIAEVRVHDRAQADGEVASMCWSAQRVCVGGYASASLRTGSRSARSPARQSVAKLLSIVKQFTVGSTEAKTFEGAVNDWWVAIGKETWDQIAEDVEFHDERLQELHDDVNFYVGDPRLRQDSPIHIDEVELRRRAAEHKEAIERYPGSS